MRCSEQDSVAQLHTSRPPSTQCRQVGVSSGFPLPSPCAGHRWWPRAQSSVLDESITMKDRGRRAGPTTHPPPATHTSLMCPRQGTNLRLENNPSQRKLLIRWENVKIRWQLNPYLMVYFMSPWLGCVSFYGKLYMLDIYKQQLSLTTWRLDA